MKNALTILSFSVCLCTSTVFAQDERFHAGEWNVSPFVTYVDKVGDDWGAGASISYFLTKRIGIGATTYWTDFEGTFIDNLAGEVQFRFPAFKIVAPYAVGSIGYEFETEEVFETLGGGVDVRLFKNISAFGDVQWRFANETEDGIFLRLGGRLSF